MNQGGMLVKECWSLESDLALTGVIFEQLTRGPSSSWCQLIRKLQKWDDGTMGCSLSWLISDGHEAASSEYM